MSNPFINENGDKFWYNEHAIEYADGWYVKGKRHRLDGPAVEKADGDKYWYFEDKLHRINGPAVEYANGYKSWWIDGKLHRLDGPAIEYADGRVEFWENGIQKFPRFRSIDSEFEVSCE